MNPLKANGMGLAIAATALVASCGGTGVTAGEDGRGLGRSEEVAQLKAQIRQIANANTANETDPGVRAALDPLVERLAAIYGRPTAEEELPVLKGAWHQIWSDDFRRNPPLVHLDLFNTYQIVTDRGYFYNLSNTRFLFFTVIGALRGAYTPDGPALDIEFTRFGVATGDLRRTPDLSAFAENIERGQKLLFAIPGNGPVGVRGKIENLYLDQDFRVAKGGTAEQNYDRYYILDRVPSTGADLSEDSSGAQ